MTSGSNGSPRWVRDCNFDILRDLGIKYIFGVPGTNEIPIIDGCYIPSNNLNLTYVQCLHEKIAGKNAVQRNNGAAR